MTDYTQIEKLEARVKELELEARVKELERNNALSLSHSDYNIDGKPSRISAAIIALFLGGVGIHHLYLKRNFWFVLYFVFSWTFVPLVISFFEGLNFLFMSDKTFYERHFRF